MRLAEKVLAGDVQAAARLMRELEDELPEAIPELEAIYPYTGRAHVVGITGAPGVGKSTLIDGLISALKAKDMKIGIVAIDPTSPFTGGAILGDRIRIQQQNIGKDIFFRSTANRCWSGGLSKATLNLIHIFDAMGKDIILVETVGSGQGEVDICQVADTTIVVLSPISGDEMQIIKAGIMEIADIYVVNKADKGGAEDIATAVEHMVAMRHSAPNVWQPSVVLAEAITAKGTQKLAEEILKHRDYLAASGELEKGRRERARFELVETLEALIRDYVYQEAGSNESMEKLVEALAQRKINPHSAAQEIISRFTQRKSATV